LVLGENPDQDAHLVANECLACGARFFDRRNACAGCFATNFRQVPVAREGEVRSFTIVTFAAPGVPVPFVAAVVDCAGTSVRANLVDIDPSPDKVHLGMKVKLAIKSLGTDTNGVEALTYGFAPIA
jgi:uncharacterized protein